jgi:hypothetical protein
MSKPLEDTTSIIRDTGRTGARQGLTVREQ